MPILKVERVGFLLIKQIDGKLLLDIQMYRKIVGVQTETKNGLLIKINYSEGPESILSERPSLCSPLDADQLFAREGQSLLTKMNVSHIKHSM